MKPLPTTLIASSMCSFVSGGDAIEDGRGIDFPSFSANTGGNWPARPRRGARPPPGGAPPENPARPDREADGEGGEGLARPARVDRGREYDEHKEERDHDLNDHRLERRNRRTPGGRREAEPGRNLRGIQPPQEHAADDAPDQLEDDDRDAEVRLDPSRRDEPESHRWSDLPAGNRAQRSRHPRDHECVTERRGEQDVRARRARSEDGPCAHDDEGERAEAFAKNFLPPTRLHGLAPPRRGCGGDTYVFLSQRWNYSLAAAGYTRLGKNRVTSLAICATA